MAGFETRLIWGSDPGLVSDRFRYTGVNVPPLDEEAIKRIQENSIKQKNIIFSPATSEIQFNLPVQAVSSALSKNPFSYTGPQPGSPFDNMRTSQVEAALNQQKAISALQNPFNYTNITVPPLDLENPFQQLLNQRNQGGPNVFKQLLHAGINKARNASSGVKELGRIAADVVAPDRNKVPDYMLDVVESPEFVEAKKNLGLWGSLPTESIAPGVLSEKQSRWLIDPKRTPVVGTGYFGSVAVPTRSGKAFKVQEGQSKKFFENEINMALRTAELELGPQVYSATFQPLGRPASNDGAQFGISTAPGEEAYRAIVRTEAVPHRKFEDLSPAEQKFLDLERYKITEGLYRGGIENLDSHFGNILLNDATKKAVQVDSGLAREYDAFNEMQLQNRLRNIVSGLSNAGMVDVAKDTSELGNALIDEAWKAKTPEMYAEVENFFNRSGNILMDQSKPFVKPVPPAVKGPNRIPLLRTGGAAIGADALLGYALGQPVDQALADAVTAPISADLLGGRPLAAIERLGPRGEFVDTRSNTILSPQGRYTNQGIAYKGGKPVIVPRGSVAGEGNFATQAQAVLGNAINTWKKRLGALGMFRR